MGGMPPGTPGVGGACAVGGMPPGTPGVGGVCAAGGRSKCGPGPPVMFMFVGLSTPAPIKPCAIARGMVALYTCVCVTGTMPGILMVYGSRRPVLCKNCMYAAFILACCGSSWGTGIVGMVAGWGARMAAWRCKGSNGVEKGRATWGGSGCGATYGDGWGGSGGKGSAPGPGPASASSSELDSDFTCGAMDGRTFVCFAGTGTFDSVLETSDGGGGGGGAGAFKGSEGGGSGGGGP